MGVAFTKSILVRPVYFVYFGPKLLLFNVYLILAATIEKVSGFIVMVITIIIIIVIIYVIIIIIITIIVVIIILLLFLFSTIFMQFFRAVCCGHI